MIWELLFMLVILKIPVAYLCAVVWWAVRAEPVEEPPPPSLIAVPVLPGPACDWRGGRRRPLPRGGPRRAPRRRARVGA